MKTEVIHHCSYSCFNQSHCCLDLSLTVMEGHKIYSLLSPESYDQNRNYFFLLTACNVLQQKEYSITFCYEFLCSVFLIGTTWIDLWAMVPICSMRKCCYSLCQSWKPLCCFWLLWTLGRSWSIHIFFCQRLFWLDVLCVCKCAYTCVCKFHRSLPTGLHVTLMAYLHQLSSILYDSYNELL